MLGPALSHLMRFEFRLEGERWSPVAIEQQWSRDQIARRGALLKSPGAPRSYRPFSQEP